ncbi:Thioredoxin-like protein 1 [Cladobotryum mycophilum]|uniref:Thioredoxin-like protein 1 n=1 Tax=Cladobotryum mycophilum TaxID=491253 RepID=A0ABR0SGG2_9HYPO
MSSPTVAISSKGQFDSLLKTSRIVVADCKTPHHEELYPAIASVAPFYADWCAPCRQIAPVYQTLAETLSHPNVVTFVKINNDENQDIAKEYGVSVLPTFLIFRSGKVIEKVQGANPAELKGVLEKLAVEVQNAGEGGEGSGSSGELWKGAEIPRGYSDITDQVEIRGCELLNADEDAGPVRVLFESSKPSALDKGKGTSKDWVQSGSDDQLLLFVPFQSTLKLHTLQVTSLPPDGQTDVSRPSEIHLFINRTQNMDFEEAEDAESTQAVILTDKDWNSDGTASIALRFVKFQKTNTLTIFVQKGDGEAESVRIDRVKLIGDAGPKRELGKLQKISDEDE